MRAMLSIGLGGVGGGLGKRYRLYRLFVSSLVYQLLLWVQEKDDVPSPVVRVAENADMINSA
jgi:hypothetical protein